MFRIKKIQDYSRMETFYKKQIMKIKFKLRKIFKSFYIKYCLILYLNNFIFLNKFLFWIVKNLGNQGPIFSGI